MREQERNDSGMRKSIESVKYMTESVFSAKFWSAWEKYFQPDHVICTLDLRFWVRRSKPGLDDYLFLQDCPGSSLTFLIHDYSFKDDMRK